VSEHEIPVSSLIYSQPLFESTVEVAAGSSYSYRCGRAKVPTKMNHKGFHGGFGSVPKKTKNAFNQPALDKLREMSQEPRYTNSAHYPRVFRQGMSSLSKAKEEIRTVEDALALKSVGPFLAKIIAGVARKEAGDDIGDDDEDNSGSNGNNDGRGGKKKKTAARSTTASTGGRKRKGTPSSLQRELTIVPPSAVGAIAQPVAKKRGRPTKSATSRSTGSTTARSTTATASSTVDPAKPSAKQTAYARAVREGEGLSATLDQYGDWRVILLVDRRERKADHVMAKCLMSGVEAEIRQLPIGDMLWIARGVRKRITPGSGMGLGGAAEQQQVEVVLGTVVERKTLEDLTSSLFGTRFEEQRLRLKNSAAGASQVLYLVEAEQVTDVANCSGATLRYAMMQTQVHLGFAVVRTKGLDDTVRYLKRVHRRLMRRSFPSEFRSIDFESGTGREIPMFTSPDGRMRRDDQTGAVEGAGDDLLFQNPPVPPFEARRHTIYEEFKAKLELARESGTRSIKALHCAMLKQIDSLAVAKVHGLTALYDTPASLVRAYRHTLVRGGLDEAATMVKDVSVGKGQARAQRLGPKSSTELAKVFTAGVKEDDYCGEEDYALKEGDEGEQPPLEGFPTSSVAAAASTASSGADVASSVRSRIMNGDCGYLSSDDDDAYERTPKRHNNGKGSVLQNERVDSDDDDLNRKPSALPRQKLVAKQSTSIQYDYELSSSSNGSPGPPPAAAAPEPPSVSETSKAKKTNSNCYDLTMDSSDDNDGNDEAANKTMPQVPTDTSNATSSSGVASNYAQDGRKPRLSHDGVDDSDDGANESANYKASNDSDSESSCDELVVRLTKRASDNGQTAKLLHNTSAASSAPLL